MQPSMRRRSLCARAKKSTLATHTRAQHTRKQQPESGRRRRSQHTHTNAKNPRIKNTAAVLKHVYTQQAAKQHTGARSVAADGARRFYKGRGGLCRPRARPPRGLQGESTNGAACGAGCVARRCVARRARHRVALSTQRARSPLARRIGRRCAVAADSDAVVEPSAGSHAPSARLESSGGRRRPPPI